MEKMERRRWDISEEYPKDLTLAIIREKRKLLKRNLLGRTTRGREVNVCKFQIHGISARKGDTAADLDHKFYLRTCHFFLVLLHF